MDGIQSASLSWLGLFGGNYVGLNLYDVDQPENKRFTLVDYVSPRYFETVGMQLVRGRGFSEADTEGSLRVGVVNEAFVRERIGTGKEAIGRRMVMTYADDRRPWTIVGVVRNAKYNDLREQKVEAMMWVPLEQAPLKITSVSMRVRPGADAAAIRERAGRIGGDQPISDGPERNDASRPSGSSHQRASDCCFNWQPASEESRCCSLRSGCMGSSPMRWRGGGRKSESGWRWERSEEPSCDPCSTKD